MSHNQILLWLLFIFSSSGPSQTISEWQQRYGPPEVERFTIGGGISLTAFYSPDGQTCKVMVEADKPQPPNVFEQILADVVPFANRGQQEGTIGLGGRWRHLSKNIQSG
jgi:hypothetical protein